MMRIAPSVLANGVSHISTTSAGADIILKTPEGINFFKTKTKMFKVAIDNKTVPYYKRFIETEMNQYQRELSEFLRDDNMARKYKMDDSDAEGWEIYHTLMDKYNVCKYFMKKKYD
jgi:hypothetical protein